MNGYIAIINVPNINKHKSLLYDNEYEIGLIYEVIPIINNILKI